MSNKKYTIDAWTSSEESNDDIKEITIGKKIKKINLAIVGTRTFTDYIFLEKSVLNNYDITTISNIISGGATGADTLAEVFAKKYSIPIIIYKPDWKLYGRGAGPIRNKIIIDSSDTVIAFWDGISPGTKNSVDLAKKSNKPIIIYNYNS